MTDQDRYTFPEPLDEEPRRFTPLLAVAGVIGALAVLVILYLLFFSGGGARPSASPSTPGTSPAGASPVDGATATPGPGGSPTPVPASAAEDFAAGVCTEPLSKFEGLRTELIDGFREYCLESIATVLIDQGIDPLQVSAAGWAFTGEQADAEGAAVSRVFLTVAEERRSRRYLVSHDDAGATIVGEPDRVRAIADDLLIFGWAQTEG